MGKVKRDPVRVTSMTTTEVAPQEAVESTESEHNTARHKVIAIEIDDVPAPAAEYLAEAFRALKAELLKPSTEGEIARKGFEDYLARQAKRDKSRRLEQLGKLHDALIDAGRAEMHPKIAALDAISARVRARIRKYPLADEKMMGAWLGASEGNENRRAKEFVKAKQLFGVPVGIGNRLKYPAFQFSAPEMRPYAVLAKLLPLLDHRTSWEIYSWFTTEDDDLGCAPADLLGEKDAQSDLIELATLDRASCTDGNAW